MFLKVSALALALLASSAKAEDAFDWNITEAEPFVDIAFSDARNSDEIKLFYNAANKTTRVKIYDYDNCNVTDSADAVTTDMNPARVGESFEVPLNVNQSALETSDLYEVDGDNDRTGIIELCVRVDVYADLDGDGTYDEDESVNFHESKIEIEIDMTKNFQVTGVVTNRTEATQTEKNATLDYEVQAYECDAGGVQVSGEQYTQGDFLEICVETNSTSGVKVANIIAMNLTGDTDFPSISSDASTSSLTERTCDDTVIGGSAGCKVKTQLVSGFFANANPSAIEVSGTAVMEFVRARRLSSFRGLQEEDTNKQFDLSVSLQPMSGIEETDGEVDMTDSPAAASAYVGMVSFVVAVFSFFLM